MIDEGHPLPEPDRRYWRRRVNRHVRKARRTRTLLRFSGILAMNLAVGAVLVVSGATVIRHFTGSQELGVVRILVDGASRTSPDAVRTALKPFFGRNLLELSLSEVANTAQHDPWVKEASVKRILPGTLRVSVKERTPGALAVLHGLVFVVDDGGFVMGPAGPGLSFDLPLLTGLDAYQGKDLADALARGVEFLSRLRAGEPAWTVGISELDLALPDRVVVTRVEGGPKVLLDPDRVDRNLDDYLRLRSMIERRAGPAATIDLRWNRRISILPTGNATLTESD
jgi:cell division protein FtsQ